MSYTEKYKKQPKVIIEEKKKPEKITEEVVEDRLYKMMEESLSCQKKILAALEGVNKTEKIETRQEVLNPAKTDEQVAAELLLKQKIHESNS